MLGQGRLQTPFKAIDALEDFVRSALRPSDHVGVIAYNRWSEFTADRDAVVALLERYKQRADRIQTALETYNSGLREQTHNGGGIDEVQRDIDAIFRSSATAPVREFAPGPLRFISPGPEDRWRFSAARFSDTVHLYGAIEYLRPTTGEKHVIALVEQGSPARGTRSRIAVTAADNRVTLHIVQTGGYGARQSVLTKEIPFGKLPVYNALTEARSLDRPEVRYQSAGPDTRDATTETGGLSFFYTDLRKAFTEIAAAIDVDYVLGYTPSNQKWRGEYRHITVQVKRPGVTVLYRHGYHALAVLPAWNGREVMTDARLSEARTKNERGFVLQLKATRPKTGSTPSVLTLDLAIEPSQVAFATVDGRHVAALDVAIWVTDAAGNTVATLDDRIDLRLTDATYERLTKSNVTFDRTLTLTGTPARVRAAVYDYDNDRLGTITTTTIGNR